MAMSSGQSYPPFQGSMGFCGGPPPRFNGTWPPSPPLNGTWPPSPPLNGTWPAPDGNNDNGWQRYPQGHGLFSAHFLMPDTSYVVATCYLSFLCVVAIVMCMKSCTRLRTFACITTYLGLTIAIVGLLQAKYLVSPNWFWAWNFLGEGLAVVALAFTIVSVGTGFYPMTGSRNVYWRMCMVVITIYATVCIVNLAYYVQQKLVLHPITGEQIQALRQDIVKAGLFTEQELQIQRCFEQRSGTVPSGDTAQTGVADWRQLAWAEREMFMRPVLGFYLGHQLLMLGTCMWVSIYLFIPLILHHRHGPVGRPVDSDMMAVGVWYLSSLMTLAFAYAVLNIFYFFNHEFLYTQQGQVLDLCLRITIGPIFFLPAPAFLLRFYREHFRKFKGGSSNGRNASGGRNWGSGNNHFNGSFTNSEHHHTTMSPDTTRIGSRIGGSDSIPRGSFDISSDRYQEPTSPGGTYGRLKMFHARDRGHSVESSRVLNRDFECESSHSQHPSEDRADSFHQYFSSMDGSKHPLRQSVALDDFESLEQKNSKPYDPLQSKEWPYNVDTPQQPQPALIEQRIRGIRNETVAGLADLELPVKSLARLATHANNTTGEMAVAQVEDNSKPKRRDISPNEKIALGRITGTTGWEVGGFNAQATSVSSAAEDKPTSERPVTKNETSTHDTPIAADDSLEGLTGLQRQLAEHRSALLPQVIAYKAYKEDLAFVEPFDHTFKPSPFPLYEPERPHQSISDVLPSTINSNPWSQDGAAPDASKFGRGGHEPESKSPIHVVEPGHWSTTSSKNRAEGDLAYNSNASNAHAGSSRSRDKSKEGIIAAFSKAIVGGGHGGNIGHTKGSSTKEGNSISHPRSSQDANDRGFKIINSGHIDRPLETSQNPTPATVEELAELSVRVREGEVTRTSSPYDYSDPYDVRTGFSSSHAAGAHASAMTKSPSASMASKGASTPSLGSFKSRESLSKSSTASREPQIRPTSPSPPSKKSSSKSTSRTARSKSDATYREGSESPRTPMSELPITASRLMSAAASSEIPSVPPAMVKTSLSPPPRQSWRRSKSFKGSNSPITAIDTSVTTETEQQSGDPLSSINFTNPSTTHSSPIGNVSSSTGFPDSCSFSSISQSHGHHASSLEDSTDCRPSQERERVAPLSPPLSGLSSRLQGTRHQRSVDNLTSAYFYKRASELNGNNTATSSSPYPVRDSHGIAVPSSLHSSTRSPTLGSPPSPSPNTYMFSYSHDNHSRKSPSPTRYGGFSPSSSPSPSATMTMANTQLGLSFGATDLTPPESRSSSFANSSGPHHPQSRMLADDPWTQAMVNRAQAQTNSSSAAGKSSGKHDRSMSPVYVMDPNARPSIARATSE